MSREKTIKLTGKLREHYGIPKKLSGGKNQILDMLIATKLSQNTTDKSSFKAFTNLKNRFGNWNDVANAKTEEIKECIKVCGLSDTKAKNIKEMLAGMKRNYGSLNLAFLKKLNDNSIYEELLKYKGIGVKTISCMMMYGIGRDVFPVDTHIHRILNRLGIVRTKSAEKTFEVMKDKIPKGRKHELHVNLIKFGRNICRSAKPVCGICFLYSECRYKERSRFKKFGNQSIKTENNFLILENI